MIVEKTPRKGGCQGSGSLAFIMKKFFKQETVVCLSFCFVLFVSMVIVYETEMSKTCYGIEDSLKDL